MKTCASPRTCKKRTMKLWLFTKWKETTCRCGIFPDKVLTNALFCKNYVICRSYEIFHELCDHMRFEVDCVKLHHRLISKGQKSMKELNRLVRCKFHISMEHKQGRNKMNTKQTDNIQELTCNICSSSSLSSIFIKFWSSGMEKTSHWNKTQRNK